MQKSCLTITMMLLAGISVWGQNPSYRVDNFDFSNGIRIEKPPITESSARRKRPRRLIHQTSLSFSPNRAALSRLASSPAQSLEGFTTGSAEIDNYIMESGKRHSVDPLLLYSIMHQESSFKRRARSHKGASGLMQLMPPTARRFGVSNIWDPKQNIEGGTRYMRFLLDYFEGDVALALAGYNAGEGAVVKYGYRVPPYAETQEYVRRIGRRYSLIRDPMAARLANPVSGQQLSKVQEAESKPLTIYERTVSAVRLPDGRLQLVSQ